MRKGKWFEEGEGKGSGEGSSGGSFLERFVEGPGELDVWFGV